MRQDKKLEKNRSSYENRPEISPPQKISQFKSFPAKNNGCLLKTA